MGRAPSCTKEGKNKGAWSAEEDQILVDYIKTHGEGKWGNIPKEAGLKRCGKSCRLRWLNYLRPGIKRGNISEQEEDLIIRLHKLLGNRWSLIAGRLPGRTDNEVKNYWNTKLGKKVKGEQPKNNENNKTQQSSPVQSGTYNAVGTEASRCTTNKILVSTPNSHTVEDNYIIRSSFVEPDQRAAINEDLGLKMANTCEEDSSQKEYKLDYYFDVGELLVSDTSGSEFWKISDRMENNNGGENESNSDGSLNNKWASWCPSPDLFAEEMFEDWLLNES